MNALRTWTWPPEANKRLFREIKRGSFEVRRAQIPCRGRGGSTTLNHKPSSPPLTAPEDANPSASVLFYTVHPMGRQSMTHSRAKGVPSECGLNSLLGLSSRWCLPSWASASTIGMGDAGARSTEDRPART